MLFKTVLLSAALLTFTAVRASSDDDERHYEPADGICSKCNCTSTNATLEDGEKGKLFSLDCSKKSFKQLFAKWPEEMGDNHTGFEVVYVMSLNTIETLQQFPSTDASYSFTCRHCKMSGIVTHAFIDAPNIITLDLAFNDIASPSLFAEIFKGPDNDEEYAPLRLQALDLSHNKISYLDRVLFEHTPHIRSLDLSYNIINQFDEPTEMALASLHQLEILDLSHTGIMDLPGIVFEQMSKLGELFLNGNKFLEVPQSLFTVGESLELLHLSENPIESIDNQSFTGLSMLRQLNISALPELTEIKEDSMKPLTSLEVLHCRGNKKLAAFSMENLRELKHLKELDVSNNALTTLNFGDMEVDDVEKLSAGGKFTSVERKTKDFNKLRVLKLAGNPWNCDCSIMKALELFDHKAQYFLKSINDDEARCKTPYDLLSKHLYDLPIEYVCAAHAKQKAAKIPIYDPPQFLRPKSIMLTVFSVVGVVVLGVIIGFAIVCIKRKLKESEPGYTDSPIRYTTVRDSTVSNVANTPYTT